ncbi:hypothetical protein O6H91_09G017300 [Diphasiastrum complanatum]|uniref:Uncharacterized protein n=1 Tax=Diphasiastrum complanatum TaxID=34168 RepID=A0ACC2CM11_DIPCM|nr:hypothetical protein O6H91_09G017300 [Diphasiastrum complanatum]
MWVVESKLLKPPGYVYIYLTPKRKKIYLSYFSCCLACAQISDASAYVLSVCVCAASFSLTKSPEISQQYLQLKVANCKRMDVSLLISLCLILVPAVTFASVNPPSTIPSTPESSTQPFSVCNTSANFQNNSAFERNLNSVLKALLNDTPSPSELTKEHVQGTDPGKVYGYSQCFFTSLSQAECSRCIKRAVIQTSLQCQNSISATILYDECLVYYGARENKINVVFISELTYSPDSPFRQNLNKVWSMLSQEASRTENPVAFAYGSSPDLSLGFAQCHNLSASDCIGRFDSAVQHVGFAMGARIIAPDLFIRYENSSFFTGGMPFQILATTESPLGSPVPQSPSTSQTISPSTHHPPQTRSCGHVSVPGILTTVIGGAALLAISKFLK